MDNIVFEDVLNFKKDKSPTIQPINVEEEKFDKAMQEKMINEITIKEIGHRYNHEKNIIMFMVFTAKRIQLLLRKNVLIEIVDIMFNLSILVLRKAMEINFLILTSLQNRENIFSINPEFFKTFLLGLEYSEQQKSYANEYCKIQNYFTEIEKRMRDNKINNKYLALTGGQTLDLDELGKCLLREISLLNDYMKSIDNVNHTDVVRLIKILKTRIECVNQSNIKFPYIVDKSTMKKFDWILFSTDLDNATFK